MTPADVANAIWRGLANSTEDIYPDAFSQATAQVFNQPSKALEQQFADMLG